MRYFKPVAAMVLVLGASAAQAETPEGVGGSANCSQALSSVSAIPGETYGQVANRPFTPQEIAVLYERYRADVARHANRAESAVGAPADDPVGNWRLTTPQLEVLREMYRGSEAIKARLSESAASAGFPAGDRQ